MSAAGASAASAEQSRVAHALVNHMLFELPLPPPLYDAHARQI